MKGKFENIPSAEIDSKIARPGLDYVAAFLSAEEPTDLQREKCKIGLSGLKGGTERMRAENARAVAAIKAADAVGLPKDTARKQVEKNFGLAPAVPELEAASV